MKKVLIICEPFPPQFAPRMGYLVKYLGQFGWEAHVVAADDNSGRSNMGALTGYAKEVHIVPQKPHRKWNLLHLLALFWPFDYLRGEYDLRRKALDVARSNKFEVVLSSISFNVFPSYTALWVARKCNLPHVLDIRDLSEQAVVRCGFWHLILHLKGRELVSYIWNRLRFMGRHYRNTIIRESSAVVSVSEWHCNFLKKWNSQAHLIYNGFDPETFYPVEPVRTDVFTIVYMGTLGTPAIRDPELLFRAVRRLSDEHLIGRETFRMKFYCGDTGGSQASIMARELGVNDFCDFLDFISSSDVPRVLQAASMLLVLTNRSEGDGPKGTLTTKFFEYLAVDRPILCVRSDETDLEAAIRETHSGLAGRTVEEVYEFLKSKVLEWKANGYVKGTTDLAVLEKYSRVHQAEQFVEVFDNVVRRFNVR